MSRILALLLSLLLLTTVQAQPAPVSLASTDEYFRNIKAVFQKVVQEIQSDPDIDQKVQKFFKERYKTPFDRTMIFLLDNKTPDVAKRTAHWIFNIKAFEREIIGKVARLRSDPFESYYPKYIEATDIAQIQKNLPTDSVLIEFAKITSEQGKARYIAWVIPSEKTANRQDGLHELFLADFGDDDHVDAGARTLYELVSTDKDKDDPAKSNKAKCLEQLKRMNDALLGKIPRSYLLREYWLLSPVADLWLVPFAALPDPDGRETYSLKNHRISYLISGRELLGIGGSHKGAKQLHPLIIGDPAFAEKPRASGPFFRSRPLTMQAEEGECIALALDDDVYLPCCFLRRRRARAMLCPPVAPPPYFPGPPPPPPPTVKKGHMVVREFVMRPRTPLGIFGGTDFGPDKGFQTMVRILAN